MLPQHLPLNLATQPRLIVNRYLVSKKIGNGTFGTVYLVEDNFRNREKKVMKEICIGEMNDQETQSVDREANLLSKLNHPNIVRMFESFVSEDSFYIIMEFCEMGDLDHELKEWKNRGELVPQGQVMDWFVQLILAVQYIHSVKMLHRDLKCKNVFLTENKTVKIGDFGISRILTSTEYASTFTGTPYYMSPEVIKHDGYGSKSDIWSLGVILYEMCELRRAFEGKNLMSVMMKIIQGNLPAISSSRGTQLSAIFTKMLKQDPHERPSSSQLLLEPLVSSHLSVLRKRLYHQKRGRNVSSASSHTSSENNYAMGGGGGSRKMTARERMRAEKQRRADEEAEQLRQMASENFAANRARTAARREREANRPNILRQATPALEIKGIKAESVRNHDDPRPKSRSSPGGGITAIHPEPRKRLSSPKILLARSEVDRQLEAIERSLELAQAESLSKAIRENQGLSNGEPNSNHGEDNHGNLDGNHDNREDNHGNHHSDSDEEEIRENSSSPSSPSLTPPGLISTLSSSISTLNRGALLETGAPEPELISASSSDGEGSGEEALLFETANDECILDVSGLELTNVSLLPEAAPLGGGLIPEDEEEANSFYSLEGFEEEQPGVERRVSVDGGGRQVSVERSVSVEGANSNLPGGRRRSSGKVFTKSSTLEERRVERVAGGGGGGKLDRSLPTTANLSDLAITDLSLTSDPTSSPGSHNQSRDQSHDQSRDQSRDPLLDISGQSDYTGPSSTVILRSDRIRTLREKCEGKLGVELFSKIHDYLSEARFGEEAVAEEVIVGNLREWVPNLTSDCFLVDQLIYLEKQELLARSALTCD